MFPYVQRVIMQYEEALNNTQSELGLLSHNNWMIYSTALLERSWLEFEKRRTADRAMLQVYQLYKKLNA